MTSRPVLAVPLAAGLSAWLGTVAPWWLAVLLGVAVGTAVAALVWSTQRRRVHALALAVNAWVGADAHEPVAITGGHHWEELAVAVNALGAAYLRRGTKLRRERPWRAQLVDALNVPALLFDREHRVLVANEPAREQFELPPRAAAPHQTAVQALGSPVLAEAVERAHDRGEPVEVDVRIAGREVRGLASPVGDEVLLVVADRTAQRQLGRIRRDFVANASHELKTPVAGIQALADALEVVVASDPQRAREVAARLGQEATRLGQLVHDLLDLQRLEDGGPDERHPVDLAQLAREQVAAWRDDAAARSIAVTLDVPDRAVIAGVPDDARLVVSNLLRNAIQYNRDGGAVHLELSRRGDAWELAVHDTGIGIPSDQHDRIFERFYRVDVARSRESGGTGLGLSLVRNAVQRQGGSVSVESLLGEGSTFRAVLPVEPR